MVTEASTQTVAEQAVVFSLAGELYGLDISRIQGIIRVPDVTRVPRAPQFVEGVINLRGEIVPIVNLRERFGRPEQDHTPDTRIINVEIGDELVGLIVDAVEEVLNIPADAIVPTPELVTSAESPYLRGIAKIGERLVTLLDLDKVLSLGEQASLQELSDAP